MRNNLVFIDGGRGFSDNFSVASVLPLVIWADNCFQRVDFEFLSVFKTVNNVQGS
jgi:hypothetical protein